MLTRCLLIDWLTDWVGEDPLLWKLLLYEFLLLFAGLWGAWSGPDSLGRWQGSRDLPASVSVWLAEMSSSASVTTTE